MECDPQNFLKETEKRLRRMYRGIAAGAKGSETERATLSGFIQAGIFLKLLTKKEADSLVDRVHMDIFGKTIEERKHEKGQRWIDGQQDYSVYDSPTHTRR